MNYALPPAVTEALRGKTVLLTGSEGFLGKHFRAAIEQCGTSVLGMDTVNSDAEDAADPLGWAGYPEQLPPPRFVIHAAGIASPMHYHARPLAALDACVNGVRNALDYCRANGSRLLFLSSSEIYGNPPPAHIPTLESYRGNVACRGSRACYDESKRLGETLCHVYHGHHGVESVTVRPFNAFGPGMSASDYRVLPNWREAIRRGETIRIYGNGNQTRTFCYVTDMIRGCLQAMVSGVSGDVYNIGSPTPEVSMLELASRLGTVLGKSLDFVHIDHPDTYPADEPQRRCPDIRKAREHFGFEPVVSLEDGLREFMGADL